MQILWILFTRGIPTTGLVASGLQVAQSIEIDMIKSAMP